MTLYHGTKHPYQEGQPLVSGGVVAWCPEHSVDEQAVPTPGCGCDLREMIWASPSLSVAAFAAEHRVCGCPDAYSEEHVARVFEVELDSPIPDPNQYADGTVMALSGRVVAEIARHDWAQDT